MKKNNNKNKKQIKTSKDNQIIILFAVIFSNISYVLNGWSSPNTIFFLLVGLIYIYFGVPKTNYNHNILKIKWR